MNAFKELDITICAPIGSYAQDYAKINRISFVAV